jgi:hypothetical protein
MKKLMRSLKSVKNKRVEERPKSKAFRSDVKQSAALVKIGRKAALGAIRTSKALNLPITYMKNGKLLVEHADGKMDVLATIKTPDKKITTLKKGMILHAKK